MATSPYQYYNEILNKWPTAIAMGSQWFCVIDFTGANVVKNNFNLLNAFDLATTSTGSANTDWQLSNDATSILTGEANQANTDNLIGCVFVREATIPSETVKASNEGLDFAGYQPPAVASEREKYKSLKVVFNETNSSFLDFVIRPWIVNVGYFGMIARDSASPKSVKANMIELIYLARNGVNQKSIFRKSIKFFNVAPISIQAMTNQYQAEGLKYASVEFVYDYYTVQDPTGSSSPAPATPPPASSTTPQTKNNQAYFFNNQQVLPFSQQNQLQQYQPTTSIVPSVNLTSSSVVDYGSGNAFLQINQPNLPSNPFSTINPLP